MPTKQVNWTMDWPVQDYTGLDPRQIKAKKKDFKDRGRIRIESQLRRLRNRYKLKTYRWVKFRSGPKYYLLTYITPSAKLIPKREPRVKGRKRGKKGGGQSQISPPKPPNP